MKKVLVHRSTKSWKQSKASQRQKGQALRRIQVGDACLGGQDINQCNSIPIQFNQRSTPASNLSSSFLGGYQTCHVIVILAHTYPVRSFVIFASRIPIYSYTS